MAAKFTISTVFSAVDKITGPIDKISSKVMSAGKKIGNFTRKVSGGISFLAKGVVASTAATASAVIGAYKLAESISNSGDEIAKTSRILGMSSDAFQKFRYVGERSGVSVDEMDASLKKLTVNLGKNSDGTIEALSRLGISIEEIQSTSPDQVLQRVAEGFKLLESPAEKATLAVDLFGKSGLKMVNVLSEGKEGINALGDEAVKVGYVMSSSILDSSEILSDKILNMQTSFKAIGVSLSSKLMPVVSEAVSGITDFFIENRGYLDSFANSIIGIFNNVGPSVKRILPSIIKIIEFIVSLASKISVFIGPFIAKFLSLIEGILPNILEFFDSISVALDPFIEVLGDFVEIIGQIFPIIMKNISILIKVVSYLMRIFFKFLSSILSFFSKAISPILSFLTKAFSVIAYGVNGVIGFFDGIIKSVVSIFSGVASLIAKPFFEAFSSIGTFISDIFSGVVEFIYSSFQNVLKIFSPVVDFFKGISGFLSGASVDSKSLDAYTTPISKDASTATKVESRSTIDVNFSNAPAGTSVKGVSKSPNMALNLGFVGR